MPLDRIIRLTVETAGGRNEFGEFVPGVVTFQGNVWATRRDRTLEDVEQEGGTLNLARRDYRVRWMASLAAAVPDQVTVAEGNLTFNVENIVEVEDARRRFIDLQAIAEASE